MITTEKIMKQRLSYLTLVFIVTTSLLAWCAKKPADQESESDKLINQYNQSGIVAPLSWWEAFLVQTTLLQDLDQNVQVQKAGKLMGSSNITVTAQVNGRVESINAKEWQYLGPGSVLVSLSDTVGNYSIQVERAEVWLERANLNYQQAELQLSKSITDAQNSLDKAQNDYVVMQEKLEQSVRSAKISLNNAQLSGVTSTALEIDKLQTELENQLMSLKNSFQSQKLTAVQLKKDVLDKVDSILWITSIYKGTVSRWDDYLGIRNVGAKNEAKTLYAKINNANIDGIPDFPTTDEDLKNNIQTIKQAYIDLLSLLDTIRTVIDSSLEGTSLTSTDIATFRASIDTLRAAQQTKYGLFVTYENTANSIFSNKEDKSIDTTLEQQIAIIKKNAEVSLEKAQLGYDQAATQAKDWLFQASLALTIAKENQQTAQKNKDLQLALLKNAIKDAQVGLKDAQRQYNKLAVTTPINAVVQEIMVDKWQEVSLGTPIAKIVWTQNNEILVSFDEKEIENVSVGQEVQVIYLGNSYTGNITAVGSVADATLSYPVTIKVNDTIGQLGWSVTVLIPLSIKAKVLPLSAVRLVGNNMGTIYTLVNWLPQQVSVELGQVWWDKIEVKTELDPNTIVVLTDMSNFDPAVNIIQLQP